MKLQLLIFLFLPAVLLFVSCSAEEETTEKLVAKGNKVYGGEFKFMSTDKIDNLHPTFVSDVYGTRLTAQIFEPLLIIDPVSGKVNPGVAKSFTPSKDARVYTFKLRKGVHFHKDACFGNKTHELTAEDVKLTLDMACTNHKKNQIHYLLVDRVKGGREHFEATTNGKPKKGGVSGIKVIDKYTIQISLTEPFVGFEKIMTHFSLGIFSKEAYKKYGGSIGKHPVGTGPFALEKMSGQKIELKRNPKYWRKDEFGNQLPFLSKVTMTYAKDKKSELNAFRHSKIDVVLELPAEETQNILGTLKEAQDGKNIKHKVDAQKTLGMMYVAMACESNEFSDVRVRRAFNLAIDRNQLVENDMEGEGWPALHGFVPEMKGYPLENVRGFDHDPELAKNLMRQAGYPNGKGFPALDFYVNTIEGSSIHKYCIAVAQQLRNKLGVNLNIVLCSRDERQAAIDSGKAKIWRGGWIADYPDPENFLALFYSRNMRNVSTLVNSFHFKNDGFDALYEEALVETDVENRMRLLAKCDQVIVDEAAIIPVLTDDHIVMINARVREFNASPMETLYLTNVYIKELRE